MNTNNNNNIQNQKNKLNNNNIPTNIIIIGGGIVGCSTAYYLTKLYKDQVNVTLIEKYKIAGCASGKAGGFLAGNWGDDETNQLHQKGFQLHEQLAKELKLKSYRKIQTLSYAYNNNNKKASDKEIAEFHKAISHVSDLLGATEKGYRVLSNIGSDGGQEVPHLHFHIFAGEKIGKMVV